MAGSLRWRDVALVVSLMGNALIAGLLIGGHAAGVRLTSATAETVAPQGDRGRRGGVDISPRAVIDALPPAYRRAAVRVLRQEGRDARGLLRTRFAARREALQVLLAEDFDREAALAALETYRAADQAVRSRGEEIVVDILEGLPPDARRDLAQRLREEGGPRRRRGRPEREAIPPGD